MQLAPFQNPTAMFGETTIRARTLCMAFTAALLGIGCASDKSGDQESSSSSGKIVPPVTSVKKNGKLIKRYDVNEDGEAEIEKVYELVTAKSDDSGDQSSGTSSEQSPREVLREKRIDVNNDGTYDVARFYNEERQKVRERVDIDRDGRDDWVSYFNQGTIARKEMLADDGKTITSTRYYDGKGELERVEVDRNDDDNVDYWEYYESGNITRVGRDIDGDGQADTWSRRRTKTAADNETAGIDSPANSESESQTQQSDSDSTSSDESQDSDDGQSSDQ